MDTIGNAKRYKYFGGKGMNDISIRDGQQNTDRIW